jgi:uncharacterized protein (TIGR04255 family)
MTPVSPVKLARSPIVEMVVDIDCDLSADIEIADLEQRARERYSDQYPGFRRILRPLPRLGDSHEQLNIREATYAFQFLEEGPQLVQLRRDGFSFNRFKPYTDLDEYLPEIKRTWQIFVDLVSPVTVRRLGLRYINRILLPWGEGIVNLDEYLRMDSRLPDETSLRFTSVLNEYSAIEDVTGNEVEVRMVVDEQGPLSVRGDQSLPVIFDIAGSHRESTDPQVWENIEATILALGRMANAIFRSSLTEQCLNLFR